MNIYYDSARQSIRGLAPTQAELGDEIVEVALKVYAAALKTPQRVDREHNASEFADAIAESYDLNDPHVRKTYDHLKSLTKE